MELHPNTINSVSYRKQTFNIFLLLILVSLLLYLYWTRPNVNFGVQLISNWFFILFLPFRILPEELLTDSGGWIPVPTLLWLVLLPTSPTVFLVIFSNFIYFFKKLFNFLPKRLPVIFSILSLILLIGLFTEGRQYLCEQNFKKEVTDFYYADSPVTGKPNLYTYTYKYLPETGIIELFYKLELGSFFQPYENIYKWNKITVSHSNGALGVNILKVRPGTEFSTACRLRNYYTVDHVRPLKTSGLQNSYQNEIWSIIDPGFCDSGYIDKNICEEKIKQYGLPPQK